MVEQEESVFSMWLVGVPDSTWLGRLARLMSLLLAVILAIPAAQAQSTTQYTNSTSAAINDGACFNRTFTVGATGTITDFVEGMEPMVFPAGTCYSMPPNVPMAAANLGVQDVTLIDNFTGPANSPVMTVLEPGWQDYLTPMP